MKRPVVTGKLGAGYKLTDLRRIGVLDLKTTALNTDIASPIEVGASVLDPITNKIVHTFHGYINPGMDKLFHTPENIGDLNMGDLSDPRLREALHPETLEALSLTGITPKTIMERGRPTAEVMGKLRGFLAEHGATSLTSYNTKFDKAIVNKSGGIGLPWNVDVMMAATEEAGARGLTPSVQGSFQWISAEAAGKMFLGEEFTQAQRAVPDAVLSSRILQGLIDVGGGSAAKTLEKESVMVGSKNFLSRIGSLAKANPFMTAAIAGVGLIGAAKVFKPLRISGRDDDWNTIEGMDERGMAARYRKMHTDFGSGYRGLKVRGQPIDPIIQNFREEWFADFNDKKKLDELNKLKQEGMAELGHFAAEDMIKTQGFKGKQLLEVDLSQGYVWHWDDADTIIARKSGLYNKLFGKDISVRLTGIDSPEVEHPDDPTNWFRFHRDQPYGKEATAVAESITSGKNLRLMLDPSASTYGRYIGLVYNQGEATSVNQQLVESGAAAALPYGESGSDIYSRSEFAASENRAISQNKGMWSHPFFQSYLDVSKGMGGRLTFNTLTDLTRLGKNYNLAAAESLMYQSETSGYSPSQAYEIGSTLKQSYGSFFHKNKAANEPTHRIFSKDDAYNTIEALSHHGISHVGRSAMTAFGSGWRGLINRTIEGALGLAGSAKGLSRALKEDLHGTFLMSPFKHNIVIDVKGIEREAKVLGVTKKELLQGTIKHERFHQKVVESGQRARFAKVDPSIVPKEFVRFAAERGYIQQEAAGGATLVEEYFAWAHTASKFKDRSLFTRMFEPAWKHLKLEAKSLSGTNRSVEQAVAFAFKPTERKIVMAELTKDTLQGAAINGLHGGHGHTVPANKKVY